MRDKEVRWSDIEHGTATEVMQSYGLDERQMERKLRRHLQDASKPEMQAVYNEFYKRRDK